MAQQCEVLLIEDARKAPASPLGQRLRALGYRTRRPRHARELTEWMGRRDLPFRAVLLDTGLPVERCSALLAPLFQRLAASDLTGLAVGDAPASMCRERLREAGFTLALWLPLDDRTLRFQVNRAFLRTRAEGPARGELRAPLGGRVDIQVGGRRKEAELYSLSERGAFLETPRPSMVGARIEVQLPLPGASAALPASVVHTNVPGNLLRPLTPVGMGIRFTDPSPTVSDALARVVVQRSRDLLV